jgi:biopolymer transport protein ExbB
VPPGAVQTEQVDVPVLVQLTPSRFDFGEAAQDGADLRFVVDGDDDPLAHELESWLPGENAVVWVRLPSVPPAGLTFYMYSGNATASDAQRVSDVWTNGYRAVWHFASDGADSTSNEISCEVMGAASVKGFVGNAFEFGSSGYLTCDTAKLDGLFIGGGSIAAVVRPNADGANNSGRIVDKSSATTPGGYNLAMRSNQSVHFARGHDSLGLWTTPGGSVPYGNWSAVAVAYTDDQNDAVPAIFVDGMEQMVSANSEPSGPPDTEAGETLAIGDIAASVDRRYDGLIDEVRLSEVSRTEDWIQLQAASVLDQLLLFGPAEPRP